MEGYEEMSDRDFNEVIDETILECVKVPKVKQKEYATEDRLHNFRIAAKFQQCTMEQALFGFLTKHLVSLSDMCKSGKGFSPDDWDEKISDAINYLLLLKAIVVERKRADNGR